MRLRLKPEKLFPLSAFHTFPLRQHAGGEPEPRKETIRLSQAEFSGLCRRGETLQVSARHLIWYAWGTAVMDVLRQEEVIVRVQTKAGAMPLCLRRSDTLGDIRSGEDALKPFRAEEEVWTAIFGRSIRPVLISVPEAEPCKDGGLKLRYEFDGNLWQEDAVLHALTLFEGRLRARFEAWRAMLWRLLEYRYWLYRISRERKTDLETGRST